MTPDRGTIPPPCAEHPCVPPPCADRASCTGWLPTNVEPVPVDSPGTLALLAAGVVALVWKRFRR